MTFDPDTPERKNKARKILGLPAGHLDMELLYRSYVEDISYLSSAFVFGNSLFGPDVFFAAAFTPDSDEAKTVRAMLRHVFGEYQEIKEGEWL